MGENEEEVPEGLVKFLRYVRASQESSQEGFGDEIVRKSVFENSFPPSARPTLRYICPAFGQHSPLCLPHLGKISHKLGRTSVRKHFSNTL